MDIEGKRRKIDNQGQTFLIQPFWANLPKKVVSKRSDLDTLLKLMQSILTISQIVISLTLITAILLQQRGAGGSALFGGGGGGSSYYTKRGFEKILFIATIVLVGLFIVTSFLNLIL